MNYEQLFARRAVGLRLGLEIVQPAHVALGRPCGTMPAIHVVGTNGKGSIAAMAAHALLLKGCHVGLYTSPHLVAVQERVRIDGHPVDPATLESAITRVLDVEAGLDLPRQLSFFEVLTLAALVSFETAGVEALVVEAGLGGRLDATRIVDARVVAFASIAMDHEAYLGNTLAAITAEKAAVMRPGVPAISGPQAPEAMAVLEAQSERAACPLHIVSPLERAPDGLPGDHQRTNAAVALAALQAFAPHLQIQAHDLDGVQWPGRLERMRCGAGQVVLDVAHNPAGIAAIVTWLRTQTAALPQPWAIVFACQDDKDVAGMLAELQTVRAELWHVALPGQTLSRAGERVFRDLDAPDLHAAIFDHMRQGGTLVVCGSHVLVGATRGLLQDGQMGVTDQGDPR